MSPPEIRDARLGFRLAFQTIYAEPPYQIVRLIPEFPEVRADIEAKTTIVWDLPQLCESIRKPGGYDVLNCTCGLPDDAGIDGMVFVSHPNDTTVVWEIDIADYRPALNERWHSCGGYLRLVFRRAEYEADIRAMLQTVLTAGTADLPVEEYDPNRRGDAYERLRMLAVNNDWSRQPILPAGTTLEFQPSKDRHVLRDGKPLREYVPRLFTRWTVIQAYKHWTRLYWHDGRLRIDNPAACDAAGREFVARLQASYAEGQTAPGVTIIYRSTDDQ